MFCSVLQGYWTSTLRNFFPVTFVYIHWARKILLLSVILILSSGIQSLKLQTIPIPKTYTTIMLINGLGGRFPCQLEQTLLEEIVIDSRMSCLYSIQAQVNFRSFLHCLWSPECYFRVQTTICTLCQNHHEPFSESFSIWINSIQNVLYSLYHVKFHQFEVFWICGYCKSCIFIIDKLKGHGLPQILKWTSSHLNC